MPTSLDDRNEPPPYDVRPVARLGSTDLDVFPLCLGGNVFGWTIDEEQSFAVLDAYADAGGNFVDTADSYSSWAPGNEGGESETIIGRWLASRGNRDRMIVATKVGRLPTRAGLRTDTIRRAAEDSLRRLRTDRIDLYYAHGDDDTSIPLEETLGAFDELVGQGKVRYLGASNYEPGRLTEALAVSKANRLASYVALQPQYNLVERDYETALEPLCADLGLACLPYYSLAMGFLTGKYRPGKADVDSARGGGAARYLDERGVAVLAVLDSISAHHDTAPAAVALSWLLSQPTVVAPIASARTPAQLADLLPCVDFGLTAEDLDHLDRASR
jgi:aryl-alcohol dehydrogenase-like predicted oxidoreductase